MKKKMVIIIIACFFLCVISAHFFQKKTRTLVSVCCIDERISELRGILCYLNPFNPRDIIGVVRTTDQLCRHALETAGARVFTVEPYTMPPGERHNMEGLARQRSAALRFGKENGYDALLFIDSDIRPKEPADLLVGRLYLGLLLGADIVGVPYGVRWVSMRPVVGRKTLGGTPFIAEERGHHLLPFRGCAAVGMGCTMIHLHSPRVPDAFRIGLSTGIIGEDIGFCEEAGRLGARLWTTSQWWLSRPEHLD